MGQSAGRSVPPRSYSTDAVQDGPAASDSFERPITNGKSTLEVELALLKDRTRSKAHDKYAKEHPGVFEKRGRRKLQTRESLIKFYVDMADNADCPSADRIRAADRIVDLLGFKISKDYDSVQKMTTSELMAAVEKVAPLIESYMSIRAKGSSDGQFASELNDPCDEI